MGYLQRDAMQPFLSLTKMEIPMEVTQTLGHASGDDLCRLREAFDGAAGVPVHTKQGGRIDELKDVVMTETVENRSFGRQFNAPTEDILLK